jgi:hypothetical protein
MLKAQEYHQAFTFSVKKQRSSKEDLLCAVGGNLAKKQHVALF